MRPIALAPLAAAIVVAWFVASVRRLARELQDLERMVDDVVDAADDSEVVGMPTIVHGIASDGTPWQMVARDWPVPSLTYRSWSDWRN